MLERFLQIGPGGAERRKQTKQNGGEHGNAERVGKYRGVKRMEIEFAQSMGAVEIRMRIPQNPSSTATAPP